MITKGKVEEIISPYSVKVRLPIIDSIENSKNAISKEDLSEATICTLPNCRNQVSVNDIVFVGFEDDDLSKPIILGHLFKEKASQTNIDLILNSLTTTGITNLSNQTSIGDITSKQLTCLLGVRENIQQQIDYLNQRIDNL